MCFFFLLFLETDGFKTSLYLDNKRIRFLYSFHFHNMDIYNK